MSSGTMTGDGETSAGMAFKSHFTRFARFDFEQYLITMQM
jgi:hypothetical protein